MRTSPSRPLALAAAAVVAAAALAACSSSATTTTGTETLSATVTGKAAAANLNATGNAPLSFGMATLAGPVTGTIKPFTLTGNSSKGTATWITSAGPLTVNHESADPASSGSAPPPATWTLRNGVCHFATTFDYGNFQQAAGAFTATTWHGSYKVTAAGYTPLAKGKTMCSFETTGAVMAEGASIVFSASGPMVKG